MVPRSLVLLMMTTMTFLSYPWAHDLLARCRCLAHQHCQAARREKCEMMAVVLLFYCREIDAHELEASGLQADTRPTRTNTRPYGAQVFVDPCQGDPLVA